MPEEVRRAAEILERRHAISLLWASIAGATRFNEFRQAVGGVAPRTLSERLRDLEDAGLLERTIVPASPLAAIGKPLPARKPRLAAVVRTLG